MRLPYSLKLTASEKTGAETWWAEHIKAKHNGRQPYGGVNSMQVSFVVTPHGLGDSVAVKCVHCGEAKDISDTSIW